MTNIVSTLRAFPQQESSTQIDGNSPEVSPGILPFDSAGEFGPDDFPPMPPTPSVGVVIRAPRGILPVEPGFTVAAVQQIDGDEDPLCFMFVSGKLPFANDAARLARTVADHPNALSIPATHVVVNDHMGTEVVRIPVRRLAA